MPRPGLDSGALLAGEIEFLIDLDDPAKKLPLAWLSNFSTT